MQDDLISFGLAPPYYSVRGGQKALPYRLLAVLKTHGWQNRSEAVTTCLNPDLLIYVNFIERPHACVDSSSIVAVVDVSDTGENYADVVLSSADSEETLAATLELWRPTPEILNFRQIADAFGTIAVRKIAYGFSNELAAAIAELSGGDFASAHRIAGLAGTLGFGRVSQAWLAIDEGDLSDIPGARREARLAQVAIARWLDANRPDSAAAAPE